MVGVQGFSAMYGRLTHDPRIDKKEKPMVHASLIKSRPFRCKPFDLARLACSLTMLVCMLAS